MAYLGFKFSEESKRKMSIARRKRITTEETKRKLSESHRGKKYSKETKEKLSKMKMGKNNHFYGKTHTDEVKKRFSEQRKGKNFDFDFGKKISIAKKGKCLGDKNHMWKGGRIKEIRGYIKIHSPNHPHKDIVGYVKEHRLIMEQKLGRLLKKTEIVHHINNKRDDNRIENLYLFESNSVHCKFHEFEKNIINSCISGYKVMIWKKEHKEGTLE